MERNSPNNSICSLTQLFGDSITLVDYEILIKDLEDLAALEIRHCNAVFSVLFLLRKRLSGVNKMTLESKTNIF